MEERRRNIRGLRGIYTREKTSKKIFAAADIHRTFNEG